MNNFCRKFLYLIDNILQLSLKRVICLMRLILWTQIYVTSYSWIHLLLLLGNILLGYLILTELLKIIGIWRVLVILTSFRILRDLYFLTLFEGLLFDFVFLGRIVHITVLSWSCFDVLFKIYFISFLFLFFILSRFKISFQTKII